MTVWVLIVMVALAALATESGLVALRKWHDAMRRKYERGLTSPWLPVEADPPTPR